jgi:hypothetical protein
MPISASPADDAAAEKEDDRASVTPGGERLASLAKLAIASSTVATRRDSTQAHALADAGPTNSMASIFSLMSFTSKEDSSFSTPNEATPCVAAASAASASANAITETIPTSGGGSRGFASRPFVSSLSSLPPSKRSLSWVTRVEAGGSVFFPESLPALSLTARGVIFARFVAASAASRSFRRFTFFASMRSIAASKTACACRAASFTAGVADALTA